MCCQLNNGDLEEKGLLFLRCTALNLIRNLISKKVSSQTKIMFLVKVVSPLALAVVGGEGGGREESKACYRLSMSCESQ